PPLLHLAQHRPGLVLGAGADLGGVLQQLIVIGLLGISLHGHGLVPDAFDFIHAARLGKRLTGGVVSYKGVHSAFAFSLRYFSRVASASASDSFRSRTLLAASPMQVN